MDSQTIITTTITSIGAIIGAIATLITALKNKSLKQEKNTLNEEKNTLKEQKQQLEIQIKEIKLISTGMVVGYFYSFIEPLFEKISSMELTISEGDKNYPIKNENTKLELIIPKQLDKISFDSATKYNTSFNVGEIKTKDGKVLYKQITYRIDKNLNEAVIFIDVPSILKSALRYYKVPMFESKKNFEEILLNEMSNFKSQVNQMIDNGDLTDKVTVIER